MSTKAPHRTSAASRAWPVDVWLPLLLLPLVLLSLAFVSFGHGLADANRAATLEQARERWNTLEPLLLDESGDAAARLEAVREVNDALDVTRSRRLAVSLAPWVRWVNKLEKYSRLSKPL